MTRYQLIINNDEAESNGDNPDFYTVKDEVGELLRSGYYSLEEFGEILE